MTPLLMEDETAESRGFWRNPKFLLLLIIVLLFGGKTLATRISLNGSGGSIEFGQGLYRVAACDGFISVALYPTPANYNGLSRVQTVELVGLNPEMCSGRILRLKFFGQSGNVLYLYRGTVAPAPSSNSSTATVDSATTLTVYDTSTAWNQVTTTYSNYAARALSLINEAGFNVGTSDDYLSLTYNKKSGTYKIFLNEPLCLMSDIYDLTVESAVPGAT